MSRIFLKPLKNITEDKQSLWNKVYLSDWFDPIYRIIRFFPNTIAKIKRYHYYGKVGIDCHNWDAHFIHNLIHAHLLQVQKGTRSDTFNTVWSERDKGLRRKLDELVELSRRASEGEIEDGGLYYFGKVSKKYPSEWVGEGKFSKLKPQSAKAKKERRIALKKDRMIGKQWEERYHELLKNYVPKFWD